MFQHCFSFLSILVDQTFGSSDQRFGGCRISSYWSEWRFRLGGATRVKSSSPSFDAKFMCSREIKRFLVFWPSHTEPWSMSGISTTGVALAKAHPLIPHHLNASVAMVWIVIVSVTTTSTSILRPFLVAISASFIYSFPSSLLHMRFSVADNFALITRLLAIGKQMRFSTIKPLRRMFELPCSMMATGDVSGIGGI